MPPNQNHRFEQQPSSQTIHLTEDSFKPESSASDRTTSSTSSGGADSTGKHTAGALGTINQPSSSSPVAHRSTLNSISGNMPPPPPASLQETLSSEISDDLDSAGGMLLPPPPTTKKRGKRRSNSDIPQSVETALNGGYAQYGGGMGYPIQQQQQQQQSYPRGVSPPTFTSYGSTLMANSTPPRPNARKRSGSYDHGHHRRSHSEQPQFGGAGGFSPRNEARKLLQQQNPQQRSRSSSRGHRRKHSWSSTGSGRNTGDNESVGSAPSVGEAAFLAHPTSTTTSHRRQPSLRAHRRQQSVQLVMETVKGIEQPMVCRNVVFLLLFVFHLLLVSAAGKLYGPTVIREWREEENGMVPMINDEAGTDDGITLLYTNFVLLAAASGICGILFSHLFLWILVVRAQQFIPVALLLTIAGSFLWGTAGVGVSPHTAVPVTGFLAFALAIGYAFIVWDRIPFAASNVVTAVAGIPWGLVGLAVLWQGVAWGATVYYTIVVCGVVDQEWEPEIAPWVYGALACSMLWTMQVVQGIVQATTAGVIGGWWHNPKNTSIVRESFFKTVFYSMGSICFGAIVVAPVRLLRLVSVLFRPSSDESSSLLVLHEIVHCIQSCLFSCVDAIAARVNLWAYTYIGMFHYDFLEAGYGATELFAMRGWSTIVSDDLVPNVFFLTSLMISGMTGCCCYALSQWESLRVTPGDSEDQAPGMVTFVEGAVIGWVMSSIIFSVISSAVNAVLVCFASSPVDLEENHPELSKQMRSAWREVWPNALDSCDYEAMQLRSTNGAIPSYQGMNNGTVHPFPVYPAEEHPLL